MLTETEKHDLQELFRDTEDEEDGNTDDYKTIDDTIKEILCEKSELFTDGIMELSGVFVYYKDKTLFKNATLLDIYTKAKISPLTAKIIYKKNSLVRIAGVWMHYVYYLIAKHLLSENITVHYKNKEFPVFFEDESRLILIAPKVEKSEPEQPIQIERYMQYLFSDLFLCDCEGTKIMEENIINTSMFQEILQINKNLIEKVSLEFELDESPVLIITVKQEEIDQKKMDIAALTNLLSTLAKKKTEPILIALEDRLIDILCTHNQSTLNYRIEVQLEPYEDIYVEDEFEEEDHQR